MSHTQAGLFDDVEVRDLIKRCSDTICTFFLHRSPWENLYLDLGALGINVSLEVYGWCISRDEQGPLGLNSILFVFTPGEQ